MARAGQPADGGMVTSPRSRPGALSRGVRALMLAASEQVSLRVGRGPLGGSARGQRDWNAVSEGQSRPIFYSLPRRRCYARHGVDRPAGRHAGLHSRFHVPSVQHGSAAMPVPSATGDQASALAP